MLLFKSEILNNIFDQIYNEFNDPRLFGRFRNFLISHGLKYTYYTREYVLSIIRNDHFTSFGEIISNTVENSINIMNFEKDYKKLNFEIDINNIDSELCKNFIKKIDECKILFIEKEDDTKCHKKQFGNVINNVLDSLGATNYEKQAYWKHISDKNIVTPEIYLGYLKYIDSKNIDKDELIKILSINNIDNLNKIQKSFLPKNITIAHQLIKGYLDSHLR